MALSGTLIHKDHFHHAGAIRNISAKGCRVDSIISPFTGMQLTVQLHIPGESGPIIIDNAAVRWSGSAGIGLEFLTVAPQSQDRLDRSSARVTGSLTPSAGASPPLPRDAPRRA